MVDYLPLNMFLKEYSERNTDNQFKPVAVGRYGIRTRESIYSKELANDYSKNKLIHKNTLTVGMGSKQIDIGILSEDITYSVSPAYHTFNISNIDSSYLKYCLQCRNQDMFARYVKRGSRQGKTIELKRWLTYEIPVCERDKQTDIAYKLNQITKNIDLRKEQLNKYDLLIKARFVEMFGSITETCEVGYYIKSLTAGKSLAGEVECVNKVLKTGAASFDYFDVTQVKNLPVDYEPKEEHLVDVGDIIVSRMNTAELTGAAAYVWDVPDHVYIPDRLWKAVLDENSNPIFVWQMLIQSSTKEQIRRECSGTGGSMKNISKAGMLGIKVKKVPLDMQNQFADFVQQVDKSKYGDIRVEYKC